MIFSILISIFYLLPHADIGFRTQLVLLSLTEKWKKALVNKGFGGALLMDL